MKNELREVILERLKNARIINDFVYSWDNLDSRILNFSLGDEIIKYEEVNEVLHKVILKTGHWCFTQHITVGTTPDHVTSPHSLAYAIDNGEFTIEEEKQIQFDKETKEMFVQRYGKNVLFNLTSFLQKERKFPPVSISDNSGLDPNEVCYNH